MITISTSSCYGYYYFSIPYYRTIKKEDLKEGNYLYNGTSTNQLSNIHYENHTTGNIFAISDSLITGGGVLYIRV
jgi:hypothetical protein